MTDQEYAAAVTDALNRNSPRPHWKFAAKIDICNCSNCNNIILVLELDMGGDVHKPLSQVFNLADVRKSFDTRFDDFAKFAIGDPRMSSPPQGMWTSVSSSMIALHRTLIHN